MIHTDGTPTIASRGSQPTPEMRKCLGGAETAPAPVTHLEAGSFKGYDEFEVPPGRFDLTERQIQDLPVLELPSWIERGQPRLGPQVDTRKRTAPHGDPWSTL